MKKFRTRNLGTYICRLQDDVIMPMDVGTLIAQQTLIAPKQETDALIQYSQTIHENMEIFFPLELPGAAAVVGNIDNWGVNESGLGAARFWDKSVKGEGVKIGIADSGLDGSISTFNQTKQQPYSFASFSREGAKILQKDGAGNILSDSDAVPTFSHWHGTFCASILVGQNDGENRGLAPASELVVAQVLHQGNVGTVASILAGLNWLADQNCDIVSLSLGIPGQYDFWSEPIIRMLSQGTVVVAAIGNEHGVPGVLDSRSPANYPISPKNDKDGILISVGAQSSDGKVADFSGGGNFNWSGVTNKLPDGSSVKSSFAETASIILPSMIAPGVDIVQPVANSIYQSESGSSMATPHIAGLLALILSLLRKTNRNSTPREAAVILLKSLESRNPGQVGEREGNGYCILDKLWAQL